MFSSCSHLAFIGPGGPEFIVIMLVLLLMFGAKDAPKILRKLNEMLNSVRNTAEGFKREIMYGDLNTDSTAADEPDTYTVDDEDYGYDGHDEDYDYTYNDEDQERDYSDETFHNLEKDIEKANTEPVEEQASSDSDDDEEDDAEKT
jgi:Sec-independent protein translocase protein TatA